MNRIHRREEYVAKFLLLAAVLALWAGLPVPAGAQSLFQQELTIPEVLATFEHRLEPATARPGEHGRLILTVRVAEGWYTYSAVSQGEFAPPPTRLTLAAGPLLLEGPLYETNPIVKKDKVFDLVLAYHQPAGRFYQNFRVPENLAPGEHPLAGKVRYQVCNNRICTPPRNYEFRALLTVEPGPQRPAFGFVQRTVDFLDKNGKFIISADTLESALSAGLTSFLLLAAGFGLLALLTPCVFPMIPITVAFFTAESGRGGRGVLRLALLFAGGMVVTYTGLGLLLTFLVGATGVGQFAVNPWVNLTVAGFFVVFALSLMGAFDLALPGGWVQALDQKSRRLKGPVGVLLMGIAFTATSFTCTMPFVGTLLIAATQGEVFWPLVGMLVFSTIFAIPFFLLALFPAFVVNLRGRGGNWLVQVKVALGLLELIAALKFVSNADLIWQWGFFDRGVLLAASAAIALATALVLLGLLPWPGVRVAGRPPLRWAVGGVLVALAIYLAAGLTGWELDAYTEAYLPPPLDGGGGATLARGNYVAADQVHNLPWQKTLAAGLAKAAASGKPIFIDFTGYTCVNCRWMEKNIFAQRAVFETLRDQFVLVQLYTDGGPGAEENQQLQIERFRTLALPYYVLLAPDNAVLAKHAGIVPTPGEFLSWLAQARRLPAPSGPKNGNRGGNGAGPK